MIPLIGSGTASRAARTDGCSLNVSHADSSANSVSKTTPQLCRCHDQSVAPLLRAAPLSVSLHVSAQPDADTAPSITTIDYQELTASMVAAPAEGLGPW
jgi:hypothetical protein